MENAETVLVIILSSFLAFFLLLSIVIAVKVIHILNHVEVISEKAESIVEKAEAATSYISNATGLAVIGKLFSNIAGSASKSKSKK